MENYYIVAHYDETKNDYQYKDGLNISEEILFFQHKSN
jgi:hypothetical protein